MPASTRAIVPQWAAIVLAVAAGPVLDAGFADRGIWPLTVLGIAVILVSLIGRTVFGALIVGFVAGCSFYLTHISWVSLFLGALPMWALTVLESLFFAVGALAITLAYRWIPRAWPGTAGRLLLLPAVVAGLWTAREAWASVWPYGGFAWGRVGISQVDGPLRQLFSWIGISGVSFVTVLLVAIGIECVRARIAPHAGFDSPAVRWAPIPDGLQRAALVALVASLVLLIPAWPVPIDGVMRVAVVQGNGKAGYFDTRNEGDLLRAQVDATAPLFGQTVDVVLWPEGSTDRSPLTDPYTASVFDSVSRQLHAPLVGWAITERLGQTYNTELLWKPGEGVVDYYDKKHPVPFGEYVPDRSFWEPFAPDLIGLIGREYTPGSTDMVFDVNGTTVGVNICFDIVDDQLLRESAQEGARVIFASSNNADFGRTDESAQQLAIARIRAMELGRSVVNVSTVGLTAVIASNGFVTRQLPWFEAGSLVEDVPLSSVVTPYTVLGRQFEWLVSGLALAALAIAALTLPPRRKDA